AWSVNPLRPMEPAFAMAMADGGRGAVRPNADTMAGIMQMSRHQSESGSNTGNRGRVRRTTETKEESERPEQKERSAEAPVKAWRALEQYGQREVAEYVRNHPKLRNIEVKEEAIGVGNEAQVVLEVLPGKEFPEGAALKVVFPEGGWEHSNGKRVRDAKIYGKAHEIEEGGITSIVYFQELVDMLPRYEKEALDAYFADLDKAGLSFEDPGSNPNKQIGISRRTNQLVTVDYATVGEPGHRQFLTDFNYGREEFEAETDVFNPEARARSQEPVYDQNFDASKELAKQDLRHSKKLSETQREILDQLLMGISVKETAEYVGYIRAAAEGKTPDLKAMTLEVLQMEKMAKKQGLL
ncbi:MAG: hypothetical protein K8F91_00220, partial [Candidatus Obscuribacterales bacterium]|nr:hypothetical protein [Candidatus Obscuribacterales bacterium]